MKNARFLGQISSIMTPFNCIKMLIIRCLCVIALIQNDTPTREMLPLKMRILSMFSERNHLQSLFLIR